MTAFPFFERKSINSKELAALGAIFLGGLCLRLLWLGKQSLWLDEMTSLIVSQANWVDILMGRVFDNYSPPLYYVLLKLWGYLVPLDETGLRLFSSLIDSGNIILFWILCRQFFPTSRCYLAVGAYAVSPFMLYYAQEGRMYSLLVFLVLSYSLIFWKVVTKKNGAFPYAIGCGILVALGVYVHYYFAFFAMGLNILAILIFRKSRVKIGLIVFAGLVGIAIFSPWIHIVLELVRSGEQGFRKFNYLVLPYSVFRFVIGYAVFPLNMETKLNYAREFIKNIHYIFIVYFILTSMVVNIYKKRILIDSKLFYSNLWVGLAPALIAVGISIKSPMISERYLIVSMPFFLMLLFGYVDYKKRSIVVILFFGIMLYGDLNYFFNSSFGKAQWRESAHYVAEQADNVDLILVDPSYCENLFQYYFNKFDKLNKNSNKIKVIYAEKGEKIKDNFNEYKRVVLVTPGIKKDVGIEPQIEKTLHFNRKAVFPLETGIVVSFWNGGIK